MTDYVLHYCPDNASLIIRLALEELGQPYRTVLVDRASGELDSAAYRAINPLGRIPALEHPGGVIYETAAILLWLADRHQQLAPLPDAQERAWVLQWLMVLSNDVQTLLRVCYYSDRYVGSDAADIARLRATVPDQIKNGLGALDRAFAPRPGPFLGGSTPSILDCYLGPLLRWCVLYPQDGPRWFKISAYPALLRAAQAMEKRASTMRLQTAEGLGPTPFTAPVYAQPPEGRAT